MLPPLAAESKSLQGLGCNPTAAVRHELKFGNGRVLQIDAAEMRGALGADGRGRPPVWIRLQPGEHLLEIVRAKLEVID